MIKVPSSSTAFKCYLTATILLSSTVPYSRLAIVPIIKKLVKKSDALLTTPLVDTSAEVGVSKEETVHALVDKWATLNLVRFVLSGTAAFFAVWATLNPVEAIIAESI